MEALFVLREEERVEAAFAAVGKGERWRWYLTVGKREGWRRHLQRSGKGEDGGGFCNGREEGTVEALFVTVGD